MQALVQLRYGGPEDLVLEDLPTPEPGPGELRVRVLACGANASDWEYLTAKPIYARVGGLFRSGRRVLGSDVMGRVDAIGNGVKGFVIGQRVLADTFDRCGGFATHCIAPASLFVPVPDAVGDVSAAALPQSGTIALAGMGDHAKPGLKVLINGAGGGSGTLAVQMAVAAGAEVTAIDNAEKGGMLETLGPARVFDFRETDFIAEGTRYDVILDLWGTRGALTVRRALAPGGRYFFIGGKMSIVYSMLTFGALSSLVSDRKAGLLVVEQGPSRLAELLAMTAGGGLAPVIGAEARLGDATDALQRMADGEIPGKLVIRP